MDNSQLKFPKTAISDGTSVLGTPTNPVRVDPTGTTVQPVSFGHIAQAPASPTSASVGVTSSTIVSANLARSGLVLINLSANTVSFGLGVAAVLNSGITLPTNGVWEMDSNTFTTAAINAIASGAATTISIQEFN